MQKVKQTKSKKAEFPIKEYTKNFIFTESTMLSDGEVYVGYHIGRQTYPLNDYTFFEDYIDEGKGMFEHDEYEYHLFNIPTQFDVKEHIDQTIEHIVHGEFKDLGEIHFKKAGKILESEVQMNEYNTYLLVKLSTPMQVVDPLEYFELFKEVAGNLISKMTGINKNTQVLLSYYRRKEEQFFDDLLNHKQARRMTEEEIEKITYYHFHRAQKQLPSRSINSLEMCEGEIENHEGYLTIKQLEQTHYIAFLSIIDLPASAFATAVVQRLQDTVSFTLETQIRLRFDHEKKDKNKVYKMRKRIYEQDKELDTTDAILDEDEVILYGEERLNDLNKTLKSKDRRLCRASLQFVVSATSKEELEEKIKDLNFSLETTDYKLYRSMVDQLTLFNQSLLGSAYSFKSYEQTLTTGYIADLGLDLDKKVGNKYGMPLGRVITTKKFASVHQALEFASNIVWFFPNLTKRSIKGSMHTNGNTLIVGPPGKGKSVLVKYIFLWLTFLGQKILYVDPKNETEIFFKKALEKYGHIPEFAEMYRRINFLSLSDKEEFRGMLDPLIFLPLEDAIQTAISTLSSLAEIWKDSRTEVRKRAIIIDCVNEIAESKQPHNLTRVVNLIATKDEELGKILKSFNIGLGKVLLGNDDSTAINFRHQINVLGIQGLMVPTKEERKNSNKPLSPEQVASTAIMENITKLTNVFSTNKDEDAAIIYDEAKFIEDTPQGAHNIDQDLRKGRANGTDIYLVTQSFSDYDTPSKKELISYKFAFRPDQKEAQTKILEFFGMNTNKGNMELIDSLKFGTCLFQDHLGRNQAIAIDVLFDYWLMAISSTNRDSEHVQKALEMEQA